MGHWWLLTLWNDGKSTPQVFIQHHETWQAHTVHYWLPMAPWISQTARTDRQRAKKKQPAEADQLSQAMSDTNSALMKLCICVKKLVLVMGDKTLFVRPSHISLLLVIQYSSTVYMDHEGLGFLFPKYQPITSLTFSLCHLDRIC